MLRILIHFFHNLAKGVDTQTPFKERWNETVKPGFILGFKRTLMILGVAFIGVMAYSSQPHGLLYNSTWSLPKGLYLTDNSARSDFPRYAVAVIHYRAPSWVEKRHWEKVKLKDTYLKRIVGIPGDTIRISGAKISVCDPNENCLLVATRTRSDRYGESWPDVQYPETIPPDHYFIAGDHPQSFDSRYYGLVSSMTFIGIAKPLWTRNIPDAMMGQVAAFDGGIPEIIETPEYLSLIDMRGNL